MAIQAPTGAESFFRAIDWANPLRGLAEASSAAMPRTYGGEHAGAAQASARVVSLRDGRELVTKAVEAARTVLAGLEVIQQKAETARDNGYLAGVPDLSRVTLGADVKILIRRMDEAVAQATAGGANLVAGDGTIRIATTGLGGSVTATVQSLDSRSLGIDSLDLSTDDAVSLAIGRITSALVDARVKTERLGQLSRTFGTQDAFMDNLRAAISSRLVGTSGGPSGTYRRDAQAAETGGGRGAALDIRA